MRQGSNGVRYRETRNRNRTTVSAHIDRAVMRRVKLLVQLGVYDNQSDAVEQALLRLLERHATVLQVYEPMLAVEAENEAAA